jgi:hypothetical protein
MRIGLAYQTLLLGLALLALPWAARGDTIFLKSGDRIAGQIVNENDDFVIIDTTIHDCHERLVLSRLEILFIPRPGAALPKPNGLESDNIAAPAALQKLLTEVDFTDRRLADIIDFVRCATGVRIIVKWEDLQAAGVDPDKRITLEWDNVRADAVLSEVLKLATVDQTNPPVWRVLGTGAVVITTRKALGLEAAATQPKGPEKDEQARRARHLAEYRNSATKQKLATVIPQTPFDHTKLVNVIDYLRNITGANFVINEAALDAAGVKLDKPITLKMSNLPADTVLTMVCGLATEDETSPITWTVDKGVVIITTRKALSAATSQPAARP